MPRKEWRLLARDIVFYFSGGADVREADWRSDPWLYPTDWSFQLDREAEYFAPKDADGVPLREFPSPIGPQYLPSRIAGYGFAHWNRWSTCGAEVNRVEFLRAADWFARANRDGRFEHEFSVAGIPAPWLSCNAQGEAASVLTRAAHLTGEARYADVARAAVRWLMVPEDAGGLRSRLPDGSTFVEEYPGSVVRHVLNGCLYAAIGVSDLLRLTTTGIDEEQAFFDALMEGLARNIEVWDVDGWSTYDFAEPGTPSRNLNTMTYHVMQAIMLRYLAAMSGEMRLSAMADRWSASAARMSERLRALTRKTTYRAVARW